MVRPVKCKTAVRHATTDENLALADTAVSTCFKNRKTSQLPIDCPAAGAVNTFVHRLEENTETVTWRQDHLRFVLRSDDPAVARRADEVLRYWVPTSQPALASATAATSASAYGRAPMHDSAAGDTTTSVAPLTFTMTVTRRADGWHFTGSQPETPAAAYRDMATVIRAAETDAALAILNQPQHFLTVHAALLTRGDDAVLIVGPSQSGKSTTSCALWAAGWQLLADDVTLLHPADATASPLLRRVSLRTPSRELLGGDFWDRMIASTTCDATPEGYVFHPDEIEGRSRARSVRLCAILFLKRRGVADPGPAALSPINHAQALLALAPYTNVVRHGGMGDALVRLGPLLNQVPSYDLGRGSLRAMIETITTLLPGGGAS